MSNQKNKELIIKPDTTDLDLENFLSKIDADLVYADPKSITDKKFKIIFPSADADFVVCDDLESISKFKKQQKPTVFYKKVSSNKDLEDIVEAAKKGAESVIVDALDWKIIPLENIIAKLQKSGTKIYAMANNASEVRTMFSILELGVDGVILRTNDIREVERSKKQLENRFFTLGYAKILEIKDVGVGERVCVDTASMMNLGEGMLVGNKSNFLFLVHNESVGSSFTSPRPFRVNAGAVHCYTIMPDGTTKYLSEMESGIEILVVDKSGSSRRSIVGRSKIETRPLVLIRAQLGDEIGTVILQNAETIRLVKENEELISVTEAKIGDNILAYAKPASGRHFGMSVDEYILEK